MVTTSEIFFIALGSIIFIVFGIFCFLKADKISWLISMGKMTGYGFPLSVHAVDVHFTWAKHKGKHFLPVENEFAIPYHLADKLQIDDLLPCFVIRDVVGLYKVTREYFDDGRPLVDFEFVKTISIDELHSIYEQRGLFE